MTAYTKRCAPQRHVPQNSMGSAKYMRHSPQACSLQQGHSSIWAGKEAGQGPETTGR